MIPAIARMHADLEGCAKHATNEKERAWMVQTVWNTHLAVAELRHASRLSLARRLLAAGVRVRTPGAIADAQRAVEYIERGEPASAVVALSWADLRG
jgi:hypothetical protein